MKKTKTCTKESVVGTLFCTKYSAKAYKQGVLWRYIKEKRESPTVIPGEVCVWQREWPLPK